MIAHLLERLLVTAGSSRPLPARIAEELRCAADQHVYHLLFHVLRKLNRRWRTNCCSLCGIVTGIHDGYYRQELGNLRVRPN